MKCKKCSKNNVISGYCKDHFLDYFEKTVEDTVKKFNLISKKDKVVVGVSGGKDSLATIYILKKLGYNVEGLAIDEGINDYRERTLKDLDEFSKQHKIKINVVSFDDEFKITLDLAIKQTKENPCHICGVFRRFLLNKYSKGYDVIATGHNLDDECQAVLMNVFKAQPELSARLGPISGIKASKSLTRRVKPLYFLKDKEVKAYIIIKGFKVQFTECPHSFDSFRASVQDELNEYEAKHEGSKLKFINSFLENLDNLKEKFRNEEQAGICDNCGESASGSTCKTCILIKKIKISSS